MCLEVEAVGPVDSISGWGTGLECGLSVSLSVNIYVYVVCQIWLVMCTRCMYMSIFSATLDHCTLLAPFGVVHFNHV